METTKKKRERVSQRERVRERERIWQPTETKSKA